MSNYIGNVGSLDARHDQVQDDLKQREQLEEQRRIAREQGLPDPIAAKAIAGKGSPMAPMGKPAADAGTQNMLRDRQKAEDERKKQLRLEAEKKKKSATKGNPLLPPGIGSPMAPIGKPAADAGTQNMLRDRQKTEDERKKQLRLEAEKKKKSATKGNPLFPPQNMPKPPSPPPASKAHRFQPAPICLSCVERGFAFWDARCAGCWELLDSEKAPLSASELFALLRQWRPSTQFHADAIIRKALAAGVGVNDVDCTTGMRLLHYVAIAGGHDKSIQPRMIDVAKNLISMGAKLKPCRWAQMTPLQYAVFYDCAEMAEFFLSQTACNDVEARSTEFFSGTLLHLAAYCTATATARMLLKHGADPEAFDNLGLTPADVAQNVIAKYDDEPLLRKQAEELCQLLSESVTTTTRSSRYVNNLASYSNIYRDDLRHDDSSIADFADVVRRLLSDKGLKIGSRVQLRGHQFGTLRFCGPVAFTNGVMAGVELDKPVGKHNGSLYGVDYFTCGDRKGVFVPLRSVSKPPLPSALKFGYSLPPADLPDFDSAFEDEAIPVPRKNVAGTNSSEPKLGSRVRIGNRYFGIVRFIGETSFASGVWYGVQLERPVGRNNGTIDGVEYFRCKPGHGIFAPIYKLRLA